MQLSSWPEIGPDGDVLLMPYVPKGIIGYDDDDESLWGGEQENDIKIWELAVVSKLLHAIQVECSVPRWHATAFPVTFSVPCDQLTLSWTVLFSSTCGVEGVLLGARQLRYLFCVFVVCGEINLSLSLCFRQDRNVLCVNSANNFCYIYCTRSSSN